MMIVGAYMNQITVKVLKQNIYYLTKNNQELEKTLHQRINIEVGEIVNNLESNYKHTDSRVDKLESKMYKDFDLIKNQRRGY